MIHSRSRAARSFSTAMPIVALALCAACRDVRIEARCTTRPAGSYCTFANVGSRRGEACFSVSIRRVGTDETFARAQSCSGPLAPGETHAAEPIVFDNPLPFDRCTFDPATGQTHDCETRIAPLSARAR